MNSDLGTWSENETGFSVVRSVEGRLSVWPVARSLPANWERLEEHGDLTQCLAGVERRAKQQPTDRDSGCDAVPCPHGPGLLPVFAETLRQHGDRPAVTDPERSLTYREVDRRSDRIAASLRDRGVGREDRVAVYLPRGVDVFVSLLSILKAGAAYVPVDTRYPAARRDLMIHASGARLVITAASMLPELTEIGVAVETPNTLADDAAAPLSGTDIPGCQAACVLFTSGSSGTPKAIVLEHRNLRYFATNPALPELSERDRVAHVSSLSFDALNFEVWCSLAAGAEIVVLPTMPDLVAADLQRELRRHRITAMLAPTMAVNHIVREDRDAFSGLRILHTGGDVVLPASCRALLAGSFRGSLHNLYGPTEGTTACTGHHVTAVGDEDSNVPIGTPLAGAHVHLLDEGRRPVPDGEPGELFIGGQGVARGYLGQPALTASRFLPDPCSSAGARMYATGDRARRRRDGVLEFLGRIDDQAKVRGYRVEPREVERILGRFPGVHDVAVVVGGQGDGRHLIALVVADEALLIRELRSYASEVMPDYMVPSAFTTISKIPADDHGKRDARELLELAQQELRRRSEAVSPRDDVERYLVEVWEELLGAEKVGVHDDFFALGGNSLLAFRLRRRISSDLSTTITAQEVLTVTVLGELADLLKQRQAVSS
nr:non-ribosomal peptide synthetase [Micromonospora orduensis]